MNTRIDNALHATFASVAFGICLLIAVNTFAASPDGVRMETVKFADLNVRTTAGAAVLFRRIHAAAERVCTRSGADNLDRASSTRACVREAQSRAIAQINLPQLTAYSETERSPPRS
jgi:UrcA family protein